MGAAGERHLRRRDEPLEAAQVDGVGGHVQQVAGRPGNQHVVHQQRAEGGGVHLQDVFGGPRRPPTPQVVDQPVTSEHPAGIEDQQRQEGAPPSPAEFDASSVAPHLERSEHTKLQHCAKEATAVGGGPLSGR